MKRTRGESGVRESKKEAWRRRGREGRRRSDGADE